MPKDWKDINTDELLNYSDANTGQMHRYDRIMRQREITALDNVSNGLFDVKKSVHRAGDQVEKGLRSFESAISESNTRQGTFQRVTMGLTVVIAIATIAYTWVTWQSVRAQREANEIQRQLLENQAPTANQRDDMVHGTADAEVRPRSIVGAPPAAVLATLVPRPRGLRFP